MIILFSSNLDVLDAFLILVFCVILLAIEKLKKSSRLELSMRLDDLNKIDQEFLTSFFQINFMFVNLSDLFQNLNTVLHTEYS